MSVSRYHRRVDSEVTYIRDESIQTLANLAMSFVHVDGATWRIEDDAVVFESPMGETLIGNGEI
jgi:hypothetical protein